MLDSRTITYGPSHGVNEGRYSLRSVLVRRTEG